MSTTEQITVQPISGPSGVQWILCDVTNGNVCGGPGANPPTVYPTIDVPKGKGQYDFVVTIKQPIQGIAFAPGPGGPNDASAALWVTTGQGQNPGQGNNSNGQITQATLKNPTELTFSDMNGNNGVLWLSYRLNFAQNGNKSVNPITQNAKTTHSIDPDIKNGGTSFTGGINPTQLLVGSAIVALVVSLIVSVILSYIIARRTARSEVDARTGERGGK